MASADGLILPTPAVPKTLGILNVIFAVLLVLFGLCIGVATVMGPQIAKLGQGMVDQAKTQVENQKKADLKTLDDRDKAATTDEEKATIARERTAVEARPTPVPMSMGPGTEVLKDPTVRGFSIAQVLSGLILHIMLLIAGIGLIRLTPWGRTLTLWWAGLQIAQLVILTVINFVLVMPISLKASEASMADLRKQLTGPNAPPNAEFTLQAAEASVKLTPVMTGGWFVGGLIYPIVCLILLQSTGARAACLGRPVETYPPVGM